MAHPNFAYKQSSEEEKSIKKGGKLTGAEQEMLDRIPDPEKYPNRKDREMISALKQLPPKKQLKVLRRLGYNTPEDLATGLDIEKVRSDLLSIIAEVRYNVDNVRKGRTPFEISVPGSSNK
jgi:hypothetical protein